MPHAASGAERQGSVTVQGRMSWASANCLPIEGNRLRNAFQALAGSAAKSLERSVAEPTASAKPALVMPLLKRSTHIQPLEGVVQGGIVRREGGLGEHRVVL